MKLFANKRTRKLVIGITAAVLAAALVIAVCGVYLGDYYRADASAIGAWMAEGTAWKELPDGTIIFEPEKATAGFIFYPGGKVEYTAYLPLMDTLASAGILCVLVEMPFHLAVLDVNAADGIQAMYPEVTDWYIGGHSLGGSMAASYLADNAADYEGLILLGSYSAADLSDTALDVLSVYGSEDRVLNREKYEANKENLPADFVEIVLQGGCHAYFGMYGAQEGDGVPEITAREQITRTAEAIIALIGKQAE